MPIPERLDLDALMYRLLIFQCPKVRIWVCAYEPADLNYISWRNVLPFGFINQPPLIVQSPRLWGLGCLHPLRPMVVKSLHGRGCSGFVDRGILRWIMGRVETSHDIYDYICNLFCRSRLIWRRMEARIYKWPNRQQYRLNSIFWVSLWGPKNCCPQTYDVLEFYAGRGNLSRCMKLSGRRTGSLDLLYGKKVRFSKNNRSNPMDILSPSGFALPVNGFKRL